MTLTELANKLREIFDFKYLTYDPYMRILLHATKPEFVMSWIPTSHTLGCFEVDKNKLDLSEYFGEDENQDYSKCIVEVEE